MDISSSPAHDALRSPLSGYESSTDDHFSDAPEGPPDSPSADQDSPRTPSPGIPLTMIEVDCSNSFHGGVHGTEALKRSSRGAPDLDGAVDSQSLPDNIVSIPGAFGPDDDELETPTQRTSMPFRTAEEVNYFPAPRDLPTTQVSQKTASAAPDVVRESPSPSSLEVPAVKEATGRELSQGEILETGASELANEEKIEKLAQGPDGERIVNPMQDTPKSPGVTKELTSVTPKMQDAEEGEKIEDPEDIADSSRDVKSEANGTNTTASAELHSDHTGTTIIPVDSTDSPSLLRPEFPSHRRRRSSTVSRKSRSTSVSSCPPTPTKATPNDTENAEEEDGVDGFGDDDFDDFGEVVEGEDFDDFEGFEDGDGGFDEPVEAPPPPPPPPPAQAVPVLAVPVLDFNEMKDQEAIRSAVADSVSKLFPNDTPPKSSPAAIEGNSFLTERSLSLWNQLVAPPPLQPPNWKLSRVRRLFLVSLGVPVDLDEILPAETKQKKLVLPSLNRSVKRSIESSGGRRSTSRPRTAGGGSSRVGSRNGTRPGENNKNTINPEALDVPSARILCSVSDVALKGLTAEELKAHIKELESVTATAGEVLTYWLKKREGAISDKETFETVIESLVGYARKRRQNG